MGQILGVLVGHRLVQQRLQLQVREVGDLLERNRIRGKRVCYGNSMGESCTDLSITVHRNKIESRVLFGGPPACLPVGRLLADVIAGLVYLVNC